MELGPFLILYTKINLKWFKDLNGRAKIIKLIAENIHANLCDLKLDLDF